MDLIPTLSTFNNKVGLWLKAKGFTQGNAPIVNPVYSVGPFVLLTASTLPGLLAFVCFIAAIAVYVVLFRHEMVRDINEHDQVAVDNFEREIAQTNGDINNQHDEF